MQSTTIYDAIASERDKLAREKARVPQHRETIRRKRDDLAALHEPWQARQRRALEDTIGELEATVERLESGEAESTLERTISPYVNAYERERNTFTAAAPAKRIQRPGRPGRPGPFATSRPSAPAASSSSSLWEVREGGKMQDVVNEMRENLDPGLFQNRTGSVVLQCACGANMCVNPRTSVTVCVECGDEQSYIDTTPAHTAFHDETNRERRRYEYDRAVHFNSKLARLQGKEGVEVPKAVVDLVIAELFKKGFRTSNIASISYTDIRAVLKQLNRSHPGVKKYYENTSQIRARITGIPCTQFPEHIEDRCREMFVLLQPVYEELRVTMMPGRKNFLNYSFTLYKILQIIGVVTSREHHTLLKGEEKIKQQDLIFKSICERLNWPWIPTPGI